MRKGLLSKIFLLFIIFNLNAQNTVGTIAISEDVEEGYTLFTIHEKTFLINNCGEVINEWTSNFEPGNSVYLLPNGNLLRAGATDDGSSNIAFGGQGGIIELFDWDNTLLWSYTYSTNQHRLHHDIYPMPNGNILAVAAEVISEVEAIEAGRDPALLPSGSLYTERIFELEPVGTNQANIVWEWNAIDHLIQDFDMTKSNFGDVSSNPNRIDINFLNGGTGTNNWLHVNSIQYDETRDQIVISSRNLSEIWIIDHSTTTAESSTSLGGTYGKGGDLLYRWGNPQSYQQGTEADRTLFGQHFPHYIAPGLPNENKLIIFNNGNGRTPDFSSVEIITPPESAPGFYIQTPNTAFGPLAPDYSYFDLSSDPSEFFSAIVSGAQQLPNGNILICEGREGFVFEIDSNENIVWTYRIPINNSGVVFDQGTLNPIGNLIFRATKYPLDYAAFIGRDLTPGDPIENNPDLSPCNNLSTDEFFISTVNVYPNPTIDRLEIRTNFPIEKIEIYNTLGQKVLVTNKASLRLGNQVNGIYFIKIFSLNGVHTKTIIKN